MYVSIEAVPHFEWCQISPDPTPAAHMLTRRSTSKVGAASSLVQARLIFISSGPWCFLRCVSETLANPNWYSSISADSWSRGYGLTMDWAFMTIYNPGMANTSDAVLLRHSTFKGGFRTDIFSSRKTMRTSNNTERWPLSLAIDRVSTIDTRLRPPRRYGFYRYMPVTPPLARKQAILKKNHAFGNFGPLGANQDVTIF